MRTLLTRLWILLGMVTATATVTVIGPATAIAGALGASRTTTRSWPLDNRNPKSISLALFGRFIMRRLLSLSTAGDGHHHGHRHASDPRPRSPPLARVINTTRSWSADNRNRPWRRLCRRAPLLSVLRTVRRRRGREQAALAARLHARAVADRDAGRLSPALAAGERALKIVEHGPGGFSVDAAVVWNTIGTIREAMCDYDSAGSAYRRAAESWTATSTTTPSCRRGSRSPPARRG